MTTVTLHEGDNRPHLRRLIAEGVRVHSVVCDPPYHLESIVKRFGKEGAAAASFGSDGAFQRASSGFMGNRWDGGDENGVRIAQDPEFWRLIHDILLPGGYVVAFASSRTFARMAVAIEDAGFITHPMLGWVFGSGFPKAHNASKAIDKHLGTTADREVLDELYTAKRIKPGATVVAEGGYGKQDVDFTATRERGGSPEAQAWDGWAYGAQALKPALEPIYVGQKPFDGKTGAPSILKHGVGALNIDGCRVGTSGARNNGRKADSSPIYGDFGASQRVDYGMGRHPANLLTDGSDEVVALFPNAPGQQGRVSGNEPTSNGFSGSVKYSGMLGRVASAEPRNDTGSAARFFNAFGYNDVEQVMRLTGCTDAEGREIVAYLEQHRAPDGPPTFYHPKAGRQDRAGSRHPTVKPIALMRWLCRLVTPPGGIVLDPFGGSGTTGAAALAEGFRSVLMEAEPQFAADIRRRFGLVDHYFSGFDDLLGGDTVDDMEAMLG